MRRSIWLISLLVCALSGLALSCGPRVSAFDPEDWPSYEGGAAATHYSALNQINRDNVDQLQIAWTYEIENGAAASNPIVIGGRMYIIGGEDSIVALDAATGAELWKRAGLVSGFARGLMYWESGNDRRILYTKDDHLRAVNANDGADIADFDVDLRVGLERDVASVRRVQSNTPGRVFGNLVIMGSAVGENYGSPVGDIRAFDVRSGALVWTFHTIPARGEPGYETWPDTNPRERHGGANAWAGMSIDEARGILYANTGSATYDFWGVDRPGDNLYADCLLALDVRTGELLWHFQYVHHDLWDYEAAATPTLMTIQRDGRAVDVVAVAGKTGFLYVFNRETGEPIWPIEETPVPTDGMEGEQISPTQPIPSFPAPFARMTFDENDIDPAIPEPERTQWMERVRAARNDGLFTPPTTRPTVQMPGSNGGANYGMTAADPVTGRFYVISSDQPAIIQLENVAEMEVAGPTPLARGRIIYQANCAMCHADDRQGQPSVAPSLVGVEQRHGPEQLAGLIQQGGSRMPAFPTIVGGAYRDLLSYLSDNADASSHAPLASEDAASAVSVEQRWRTQYGYLFYSGADRPAIAPPWSTLTAYDLNSGAMLFQTVVGHNPAYPIANVRTGLPLTKIGPIVTAGGLLFVATSLDRRLEAYDAQSGESVWSTELPAAALGIPSTYAVNGRQFIVVPAAASGSRGSHEADTAAPARNAYVAYALPLESAQ